MQVIIPHFSCLVNPHEFEDALKEGYSEVYVNSVDSYYKHIKLSNGRHARIKVKSLPTIPGVEVAKTVIEENLNFLPAGKIPYDYFEQISSFFRQVMKLKKADYEAHAWILWSKEKGYFISVPKQSVSKASVSFTYDDDSLPPGSVIVVDLHSHNTMGAFYSGTDNNNDKSGIYYSGVIGKITDKDFEYVIRFNLYEDKMECKLEDIFEMPEEKKVVVPQEWIDQIEVKSFAGYPGKMLGGRMGSLSPKTPSLWEEYGNYKSLAKYPWETEDEDEVAAAMMLNMGDRIGEHGEVYVAGETDEIAAENLGHMDEFDYNAVQHGEDAASAMEDIESALGELEGKDSLLLDIIRQSYHLLGDSGKNDLAHNGF